MTSPRRQVCYFADLGVSMPKSLGLNLAASYGQNHFAGNHFGQASVIVPRFCNEFLTRALLMFDNLAQYSVEFLTIASVHLLAVASPGPDFAVVLKHSVNFGRRAAMLTSIGVGLAILVHVAYSLLGIGILIQSTPGLFQALSYAAAAYLLYIGWSALKSKPGHVIEQNATLVSQQTISDKKAFWTGFLTNGLNPKATLFFLSVFAVVVSAQTPNTIKLLYGLYLAGATALWFCMLSYCFSSLRVRELLSSKGYWFDRVMGVVLILLAIRLVLPT